MWSDWTEDVYFDVGPIRRLPPPGATATGGGAETIEEEFPPPDENAPLQEKVSRPKTLLAEGQKRTDLMYRRSASS